jgi:hypothetical protein
MPCRDSASRRRIACHAGGFRRGGFETRPYRHGRGQNNDHMNMARQTAPRFRHNFAQGIPTHHTVRPLPKRPPPSNPASQPSPTVRRVGVHDVTFEACRGFTGVTAHKVAATSCMLLAPRLWHGRLPRRTAWVATEVNRKLLGRISHPLVLHAFVAHRLSQNLTLKSPHSILSR